MMQFLSSSYNKGRDNSFFSFDNRIFPLTFQSRLHETIPMERIKMNGYHVIALKSSTPFIEASSCKCNILDRTIRFPAAKTLEPVNSFQQIPNIL
mgnify:CR=1 FL=1